MGIIILSIVLTIVVVIRMGFEIAHSTAPDVDNVIFPKIKLSSWFLSVGGIYSRCCGSASAVHMDNIAVPA